RASPRPRRRSTRRRRVATSRPARGGRRRDERAPSRGAPAYGPVVVAVEARAEAEVHDRAGDVPGAPQHEPPVTVSLAHEEERAPVPRPLRRLVRRACGWGVDLSAGAVGADLPELPARRKE